jgi:N-methylhydantoinase B
LLLEAGTSQEENRPKVSGARVAEGVVVSHRTGGGGGYGDPRDRELERIRDDVEDGYVSAAAAYRDYGVNLDLPQSPPASGD